MTAPVIIRQQREQSLVDFEEDLKGLGASEELLDRMQRSATLGGNSAASIPRPDDVLGNASYTAAALAALAEVVVDQQERIGLLEEQLSAKAGGEA